MGMNVLKVAVIGAGGDLGSQLSIQLLASALEVHGYELSGNHIDTITGADLVTTVRSANQKITWERDLMAAVQAAQIVHWCAPLAVLTELRSLPDNATLVLHDSVMSRSVAAKMQLLQRLPHANVSIAHCLMNRERMVVVANNHDDGTLAQHFTAIGMHTKHLTVQSHDQLMAHSQAPLALLCAILLDDLEAYHEDGLLTNSGQALLKALQDRSANWTDTTMAAILDNPELPHLIERMKQALT